MSQEWEEDMRDHELTRAFVLESVWTKVSLNGQHLLKSLDMRSDSAIL